MNGNRGALMPGGTIASRLAASPGWAMAQQAGRNINALRQGTPLGQTPAQAYQQHIADRALLRQRDLRAREAEQRLNPFFEYEEARRRGYIPEEMSLEQFNQMNFRRTGPTSVQQNYQTWLAVNPGATDEQKREALNNIIRAPSMVQMGGGGVQPYNPLSGTKGPVVTPEEATRREAGLAGATTAASEGAKFTQDQVSQATEEIFALEDAYSTAARVNETSQEWLGALERGEVDTGPINRLLFDLFGMGSEELAQLNAEGVEQLLNNLQIVNLAPVTENEMRTLAGLWAEIGRQETPNKGLLRRAVKKTQDLMERIQTKTRLQGERLRERAPGEFDLMMRVNPYFKGVFEAQEEVEIPGLD